MSPPPADGIYGNFTDLKKCTKEEYAKTVQKFNMVASPTMNAHRVLDLFEALHGMNIGNIIDQYDHGLQTATRALNDGCDEETVVVALLHDIGEVLSPVNHGEIAAGILRPYISPTNYWTLMHHEVFQAYYYQDAAELKERNARDYFKDNPHYASCFRFCEKYDSPSFDPEYENLPLEHFIPMVERVFNKQPYWHPEADYCATNKAKKTLLSAYPMDSTES